MKKTDGYGRAPPRLVEVAHIIDALFLRQVWAGNDALMQKLSYDTLGPSAGAGDAAARLHYFLINKGPWSRLDHNRVFVPGVPPKPVAANFYPEGASKADLERWIQSLPEAERSRATGFFTVIRRAGNSFTLVPYSIEYQAELTLAAARLREAAQLATE